MLYHFKEAQLGPNFCQEKLAQVKKLISSSTSFTILGMPGVGVSFFLRYLASTDIAHFVFVDMYALSTLSKKEYLSWLLHELGGKAARKTEQEIFEECNQKLEILAQKNQKIVIIFNRFDQLQAEFDKQFLASIRSFRSINPNKIMMIFTANKPLYEIAPEAIIGTNLNFYSQIFYFGTYSKADLRKLSSVTISESSNPKLNQLVDLSGGHNQLLMIMAKSESQENMLADRFVKLQLRELYEYLDYQQKKTIEKIALGKKVSEINSYLVNIGMVNETPQGYKLFSPLLEEYLKSFVVFKIPAKEGKLFKLLKQNLGEVVSKDQIFDYIWPEDIDSASDWALNALIYRLRSNPQFRSLGFYIENHKKVGYKLIKSF